MNEIAERFAPHGVGSIFLYTHEAHPGENYPHLTTGQGQTQAIPLEGQSPAEFCQQIKAALAAFGLTVPFDDSVCDSAAAGVYDKTAVSRYWQALSRIDLLFKQFRHGFREESSSVQLWPHHLDLALLWFSGRLVADQDPDDILLNFLHTTHKAGSHFMR